MKRENVEIKKTSKSRFRLFPVFLICFVGSCLASCMATIEGSRLRFDSIPKGMAMASVGLHPTAVEVEVNVIEMARLAISLITGVPADPAPAKPEPADDGGEG